MIDALRNAQNQIAPQLAAKGVKPGWYQAEWRGWRDGNWTHPGRGVDVFNRADCTLAVLDALINQGGVPAWNGDGVGCVVQMIELAYRERDDARAEVERLQGLLNPSDDALSLLNPSDDALSKCCNAPVVETGTYECEQCGRMQPVPMAKEKE